MEPIVQRFLDYISYETTSDESSTTCPSTPGQLVLAKHLVEELKAIGMDEVVLDENGYVYATLRANTDKTLPTVGFIAHMDTAPDLSGKDVKPQFVEYQGGDIPLNDKFTMMEKDFPFLKDLVGETLITTDGTTLLGADDKAGIAMIVDAMDYLIRHPEVSHGTVKVGFTPDEEIGRGADLFNIKDFGADFAFTVDGGAVGGLEYENFNAASAHIDIQGKNVHPGSAKDIMVNALYVAIEFNEMLPAHERPEHTEGYEGFYMLDTISGAVDGATMEYIIRDHDREKFEAKKALMEDAAAFINKKYGDILTLTLKDGYYNMREKLEPHMEIVELAIQAMKDLGIEPAVEPIRGGTDGSKLSFEGLLTPNIFAGGYNFHGRYEFIPVSSLGKGRDLIVKIVENLTK
ncbi:peptidase T [Peptoniphilus equinus]|uniref:Peptidase T n=1 Tax=Peptoniphilus equinus TaxID=3016343 RepID=A0ABY7QQZ3_9FIRM|nr:peptidase T [Peptoniphilus equinus]WBW49218.1 peptidase T [Peptoniphilus equinus]